METNGSEQEVPAPSDEDRVEVDPTGRYIRYRELLGKGAYKKVYKAFDELEGIEVAWNKVSIDQMIKTPENVTRLHSEVHFLRNLKHENILKFYNSWVDHRKRTLNIITELFTSGSLKVYRKKHKEVDLKAIKGWARQILRGLEYLHSHNPPIIHRDLKCDNIFVNGHHGEVKIGDLGLTTIMQQQKAKSVVGTPEFMAPELYDEEYTELADIYSFGMCMLEMVTLDYPYGECKNAAQIFKCVTTGVKPAALEKVKSRSVKKFIEKCLVPPSQRPSASELLRDPFLLQLTPKLDTSSTPSSSSASTPTTKSPVLKSPVIKSPVFDLSRLNSLDSIMSGFGSDLEHPVRDPTDVEHFDPALPVLEFERASKDHMVKLRGQRKDRDSVSLVLSITHLAGQARNIHFLFFPHADTALSVASEMVEQLELEDYDVAFIAGLIDSLITDLIPFWTPSNSEPVSPIQARPVKPNDDVGVMLSKQNGEAGSGDSEVSVVLDSTVLECKEIREEAFKEMEDEIEGIKRKFERMSMELLKERESELAKAREKYMGKKGDE